MSLSFKVRGTLYSFPDLERILSYRDRPLHGGRGLKLIFYFPFCCAANRPLHGGRGLKLHFDRERGGAGGSPPSRGARIETRHALGRVSTPTIAPFTGGAD